MSKAKSDTNSVDSLAREIDLLWQGSEYGGDANLLWQSSENGGDTNHIFSSPEDGFNFIAALLYRHPDGLVPELNFLSGGPPACRSFARKLTSPFALKLQQRLLLGADLFISQHKLCLLEQGLERFSEAGLNAFFFSALYEAVRFQSSFFAPAVADLSTNKKAEPSRHRPKRRGAGYFTPPGLAYLAAHRALGAYFKQSKGNQNYNTLQKERPLPLVFDPAMGTGLYLVAALDYLSIECPGIGRLDLAKNYLSGVDMDAITCGAAKNCLALAVGVNIADYCHIEGSYGNLFWADSLLSELPPVDIVLSNPPWDIVKATQAGSGRRIPSRVNKARSASLRQPYIHQGEGDTSYYKLFLERTYQILKPGGIAAVLTPASFCGDKGAAPLRSLLVNDCQFLSLDGFINEDHAFAIHPQYKYNLLCFKKGHSTEFIDMRFGQVASRSRLVEPLPAGGSVDETAADKSASTTSDALPCSGDGQILYTPALIKLLGGQTGAILELDNQNDVDLLTKLYQKHPSVKDFLEIHGGFFRREFDMTLDRYCFVTPRRKKKSGEQYLPLLEGRMIGQFDPAKQTAAARYFIETSDYRRRVPEECAKIGFVSTTSPYNTRSMIAAYLPNIPAGNSLPTIVFKSRQGQLLPALEDALYSTAIFNSFVFDYLVRLRLTGNNLSYHLLSDLPFPAPEQLPIPLLELTVALSAMLSLNKGDFSAEILTLGQASQHLYQKAALSCFGSSTDSIAIDCGDGESTCRQADAPDLLRLRVWLEVLVCELYGLSREHVEHVLRDCDLSQERLSFRRHLNKAIGAKRQWPQEGREPGQRSFFRVDKNLAPEVRLSNLVNCSFAALKSAKTDFAPALIASLKRSERPLSLPNIAERRLRQRFGIHT
jgi:hypothetical protein